MATEIESTDLDLSEIWDALTDAGATIYLWCEVGFSTGIEVIRIGKHHYLSGGDSDGFMMMEAWHIREQDLIPKADYHEEDVISAASDLAGFFGVTGRIGSLDFDYRWFPTEAEAKAWADAQPRALRSQCAAEILPAAEAFACTYLDGSLVFFCAKETGPGFEPKMGPRI